MEIARLEVSMQQHLDRMQETVKVNYIQYGKSTEHKKGKKSTQSGASGGNHRGNRGHGTSSRPGGKGKKLPFLQDTCYRCRKGRHQKTQDCKTLDAVCRGCGKKGHFEKVCLKAKHATHSLEVPQASIKLPPVLQGPVNLFTLMMMDNPYLHIWSVFLMQTNI